MNVPCPNVIPCPGTDDPFANLSSEEVDTRYYKKMAFAGLPDIIPPLGTEFSKTACAVVYNSTISQEDADRQAEIAAEMCVTDTWENPDGDSYETYFNNPQTYTVYCPDGSPFSYTVASGMFGGLSQAIADAAAYSYAKQQASAHRICLDSIDSPVCADTEQNVVINLIGAAVGPFFWEITSGSIPTGMEFHGGYLTTAYASITGIPTAAGTFSFTVKCTNGNGDYMSRQYTLGVADLSNALPLNCGNIGSVYTVQLTVVGFNTPFFSLESGALPDGLSMDSDGLIYGTPTTIESASFSVKVTEASP